jgi:glucose-1-phosphate cytidylyltransferase
MAMSELQPADVPVVILCGGKGTRIREASESLPKPMIDIGGKPIVWHIMKLYGSYGFRRFVLLLGYRSWTIKEYFLRYREQVSDFTVRLDDSDQPVFHGDTYDEDFEVSLIYTGLETLTGGRLSRARSFLDADTFMLTYGDGLADVDLGRLLVHHRASGALATVTAVHPTSRFGELTTEGDRVVSLAEKPELQTGLVNGGFFAFQREVLDLVHDDSAMLETDLLQRLAASGQLSHMVHRGFWRGMDTYREYVELNGLWDRGEAPWRTW